MKYLIGCSGFHYKHWRGNFYPEDLPVKKWFEFYSQRFNTLELNVSFYRFPTLSMLQNWYTKSPAGFVFTVKAPRSITHFKKLLNAKHLLADFYEVIETGLKEKLGCVLFQFPPNFAYSEDHLQRILGTLDPSFKNVVEFRHASWWNADAFRLLSRNHIIFCGMSHPDFPTEIVSNSTHIYYRMHGDTQLYASNYSDNELQDFGERLTTILNPAGKAYIYFNNDINGCATENANYLQRILNSHTL
jgi:uncharacterized protein YecE (DUF72 family)